MRYMMEQKNVKRRQLMNYSLVQSDYTSCYEEMRMLSHDIKALSDKDLIYDCSYKIGVYHNSNVNRIISKSTSIDQLEHADRIVLEWYYMLTESLQVVKI